MERRISYIKTAIGRWRRIEGVWGLLDLTPKQCLVKFLVTGMGVGFGPAVPAVTFGVMLCEIWERRKNLLSTIKKKKKV